MNAQEKISEAKAAVSQNNPGLALEILKGVLKQDTKNIEAWLLMADVVDNPHHAVRCLQQVLKLDPDHAEARSKLNQLEDPFGLLETPISIEAPDSATVGATSGTPPESGETVIPLPADAQRAARRPQRPPAPQAEVVMPPPLSERLQKAQSAPSKPASRKAPRKKSGRWLEISLLIVVSMCLCLVVVLLIGQNPNLLQTGPTPTPQDVRSAIYENMHAANAEDLDRYMDTIHPRASGRFLTRSAMKDLFDKYDLHYRVSDLRVLEVTDKEARVSFALTTRKINGPAFQDNWITGVMILRLDGNIWKIYTQEIDQVVYLND
jgi:hypothetical protein